MKLKLFFGKKKGRSLKELPNSFFDIQSGYVIFKMRGELTEVIAPGS